jgi:hypothetical protein
MPPVVSVRNAVLIEVAGARRFTYHEPMPIQTFRINSAPTISDGVASTPLNSARSA